jgi:hypothetical protein
MNSDNKNQVENEIFDSQAKKIASLLDANANRLSMRTLKQLENARLRAVKAHEQQLSGENIHSDGTLSQSSSWVGHRRLAITGLVLAAIIGSIVVIKSFKNDNNSDAFLLSSDLPPEAFVDKGFEPSLNIPEAHLQQKT